MSLLIGFQAAPVGTAQAIGSTFTTVGTPEVGGDPAEVGGGLLAFTGVWSPTPDSYTYQWLRGGIAIDGATSNAYQVVLADAGSKLSVRVTAIKAGYTSASATSAETATVPLVDFTTTGTPSVSGTAKVGVELTAAPGSWSPTPDSFDYQWLRDGAEITGETASTYTPVGADQGKKISVRVTAIKTGYTQTNATSAETASVAAAVFTPGTPEIMGTPVVGGSLWVDTGSWDPTPDSYSYQWLRNGNAISGATNESYRLVAADLGTKISARVTASKTGLDNVSATSAQTSAVTSAPGAILTAFSASSVTITSGRCIAIPLTATYQVSRYQAWSITKVTLTTKVTNKHGKKIGTATLTGSGPDYTPRSGSVKPAARPELIGTATGTFNWCSKNDLGAIRFAAPTGTWVGTLDSSPAGGTISALGATASAHVRAGIKLGTPTLTVKGTKRTLNAGFRAWVPSQKAWKPLRGSMVTVQKLVGSTWTPMKTVKISVKGKVKVTWKATEVASYRLVFAGTGTKIAVTSGVLIG